MLPSRGVVKVGIEIEVPSWINGHSSQKVCKDLIKAGYMLGPLGQWNQSHQYGCRCRPGGCSDVRSGTVLVPPLVSLTYDGSLPRDGGEFVVSPVILIEGGVESLAEIWTIITTHAEWTMSKSNYHGNGNCSPSIHVHCSVTLPEEEEEEKAERRQAYEGVGDGDLAVDRPHRNFLQEDIILTLALFSPEFILLADRGPKLRRGLEFRMPMRIGAGREGHHSFVHIRDATPGEYLYIEWRMFEAIYRDWDYIKGGMYLSAAMTRALLRPGVLSVMTAEGYSNPYKDSALMDAVRKNDTKALLALVNVQRLEFLAGLVLTELDDDKEGYAAAEALFKEAFKAC